MNRKLRARLAAVVGTAALALGGAVIAAPAAHAGGPECATYLAHAPHLRSTSDTNAGCAAGGTGLPLANAMCKFELTNFSQVPGAAADTACRYARS
ncbi:hypothetical protein AB0F13_08120 [Streptomyces sp. NPDC026206]|uniref:hypothetical protein n=1 Tax=Streptomyces sp. NPDC026206 TaxID=3157089 RepID=UPI0033CDEEAC